MTYFLLWNIKDMLKVSGVQTTLIFIVWEKHFIIHSTYGVFSETIDYINEFLKFERILYVL